MSAWRGGWFGGWTGDWFGVGETAESSATAEGVVLTVVATLRIGRAVADRNIHTVGAGFVRPRLVRVDGKAKGRLLTCRTVWLPGRAEAVSLFPGMAHGAAVASGDLMATSATIVAGAAEGELFMSDEEILVLAEAA